MITRRAMLSRLAFGLAGAASGAVSFRLGSNWFSPVVNLPPQDDGFLEEIERASFRLFWENAHPQTGQVQDRVRAGGNTIKSVSSIAATGFGLSALCLADQRAWLKTGEARERARATLRFIATQMPHVHGFYYHFVDWGTGKREWRCEVSSIDTAILLCGVLTCRQHFDDAEIQDLAAAIYDRIDWQWLYQKGPYLSHGWTPERGFLASRWDTYSEHMMLYLLAVGANRKAIPAEAWHAWKRPVFNYAGLSYIDTEAPLFIHQYAHAWVDFRNRRDEHADYFENSVFATQAHRAFCLNLRDTFPNYTEELWGITASDSPRGYVVWGGPPRMGPIDGSVVPCAAAGSLPFLRNESLQVLRTARERYGKRVWRRYGFADAFNPTTGWVARDHVAINTGIALMMAENARTSFFWDTFMKNPEIARAMQRVGFRSLMVG
ncbi:MAG TPA: glucoamylase family protein [Verrucomicrobiae bacterium]|nr:glucoamylase family protein [Verrucomicrobiae bacterium]